jgi:hypothetical protein
MMDRARGPSRIVTMLQVFSAADIYIFFGLHDREAVVPSDRPHAGQKSVQEGGEVGGVWLA